MREGAQGKRRDNRRKLKDGGDMSREMKRGRTIEKVRRKVRRIEERVEKEGGGRNVRAVA